MVPARGSCGGVVLYRSWVSFAFSLFLLNWISSVVFPDESCRALQELHFPALGRAGKARAQSWVAQLHSGGFQQEASPSPGDTVNGGSCSKPVLTLTPWTVVKTWAQVTLSLRRTRSAQSQLAFAEGFGGSVTTHITSVGSLLPNVPEQGRGKEAAGGCSPQPSWAQSSSSNSCWHLLPSGLVQTFNPLHLSLQRLCL